MSRNIVNFSKNTGSMAVTFKTDNINIGDFIFDGIICTEIDEESFISSPTMFSVK